MRLFQISFLTARGLPVTTGVGFRGINDTGPRHEKFTYWDSLFDVGLRGEMGEFGDYFKTWNWEAGFSLFPERGAGLVRRRSQPAWIAGCAFGYEPSHRI